VSERNGRGSLQKRKTVLEGDDGDNKGYKATLELAGGFHARIGGGGARIPIFRAGRKRTVFGTQGDQLLRKNCWLAVLEDRRWACGLREGGIPGLGVRKKKN